MAVCVLPWPAAAQIDADRAAEYFAEAAELCEREAGRLWGVSLCGPMVFADPVTKAIATNRPAPDAPRPRALGYANAAMEWGDERWSTFVWQLVPKDDARLRGRLMLHELFHRVQPDLGLFLTSAPGGNDHLETLEGRYWMQLEWRALARALESSGPDRVDAIGDALAFRQKRRASFPGSAEIERISEINEGLAQYTGTVASAASTEEAAADAVEQLATASAAKSFVRTFAYPSGAAYGILLDAYSPGWTRGIDADDDLGDLLASAAGIESSGDADAAAERYGGAALRLAEEKREAVRRARVAELRRIFVEGPVLRLPRGRGASFLTDGVTPIPGAGTVYPTYRVTGEWGSVEADWILVSPDQSTLTVPAPESVDGSTLEGDGWKVTLEPGWAVRPDAREGDYRVVPVE